MSSLFDLDTSDFFVSRVQLEITASCCVTTHWWHISHTLLIAFSFGQLISVFVFVQDLQKWKNIEDLVLFAPLDDTYNLNKNDKVMEHFEAETRIDIFDFIRIMQRHSVC